MVTRTNSRQVVFRRPFLLSGFDALQPAGTYTVDTEEELIDALSFPAWKRVMTAMQLTRSDTTEYIPIDPDELHEALMRDGALPDLSTPVAASAKFLCRSARDTMKAFQRRLK